jgi:hypothetical protein
MTRPRRAIALVFVASGGLAFGQACIDLFHSTDFDTLCSVDAAACSEPPDGAVEAAVASDSGLAPEAAPPVPLCAESTAAADDRAAHACLWLRACQGALGGDSFATCMLRAHAAYDCSMNPVLRPRGEAEDLWRCLFQVKSCADVNVCLYADAGPPCSPANDEAGVSVCRNGTTVQCYADHDAATVEACALENRDCTTINPSQSACTGPLAKSCAGESRCVNGTHASRCAGTADFGLDCATLGEGTCFADDAGVACVPTAEAGACDASTEVTCSAGVAHSCVGGRDVTIDCSILGLTCTPGVSSLEPLVACHGSSPGPGCVSTDACGGDGGDLVLSCAQNKDFARSCSAVGLGPCAAIGAPRPNYVSCTAPAR